AERSLSFRTVRVDRSGSPCSCSWGTAMSSLGLVTKLALRMKRRKTVSVTPAMGARMVAGEMRTLPIWTDSGTFAPWGTATVAIGFSQNLCISSDYFTMGDAEARRKEKVE